MYTKNVAFLLVKSDRLDWGGVFCVMNYEARERWSAFILHDYKCDEGLLSQNKRKQNKLISTKLFF